MRLFGENIVKTLVVNQCSITILESGKTFSKINGGYQYYYLGKFDINDNDLEDKIEEKLNGKIVESCTQSSNVGSYKVSTFGDEDLLSQLSALTDYID